MKKLLLLGFFISVLAFAGFWTLEKETYLYVASLHLGMLFLALFFIYEKNWQKTMKKLGIPGDTWQNIKYLIGGLFAIIAAVILLNVIFYFAGIEQEDNVAEALKQLPPYIILFGIVFAPISEELFFRGFLVDKIGIFFSSTVFALSHFAYGSIAEIIGAFTIGLILAYIYKKSQSILPVIGIHFLFNLLSVIAIMLGAG